jgi:hypothetical protein
MHKGDTVSAGPGLSTRVPVYRSSLQQEGLVYDEALLFYTSSICLKQASKNKQSQLIIHRCKLTVTIPAKKIAKKKGPNNPAGPLVLLNMKNLKQIFQFVEE